MKIDISSLKFKLYVIVVNCKMSDLSFQTHIAICRFTYRKCWRIETFSTNVYIAGNNSGKALGKKKRGKANTNSEINTSTYRPT